MMQVIRCECGENSMQAGRCIGCKRARPSSDELLSEIKGLHDKIDFRLEDLKLAIELEKEERNEKTV